MSSTPFEVIDNVDVAHQPFMNDTMETSIREYVARNKPTLCILTPCYGGLCHVNYTVCLIETIKIFLHFSFPLKINFCKNDSLVSRARNNLIAKAMHDDETTHILFIDNDISWKPIDIFQLILSDKSIIGGAYPLKRYEWKNCLSINQELLDKKNNSPLKDMISDDDMIRSEMLRFNVNYLTNPVTLENFMIKVRHVATGFMMIQRRVIENMILAYPSTKYTDDIGFLTEDENKFAYALFDCCVEGGHYLSEDWLFCNRWRKMNEDVFIHVGMDFVHTGMEDYAGSLLSSLLKKQIVNKTE